MEENKFTHIGSKRAFRLMAHVPHTHQVSNLNEKFWLFRFHVIVSV